MSDSFLYLSLLATIQGLTEFLPVSSSAHLILLPSLTNHQDQGIEVDVALHFGSILAVILTFHKECRGLLRDALDIFSWQQRKEPILLWHLIIATIPIIIVGFFAKTLAEQNLRNLLYLAFNSIFFALLLFLADRNRKKNRLLSDMTWRDALVFGLMQIFALMPGASRSGVTMTAGRFLGFSTLDSAKFSILMAIPVILSASALIICTSFTHVFSSEQMMLFAIATVLSFISSYIAINAMMLWLKNSGFTIFIIYRIILGLLLLALYL